jgi:hypothetical protein
MQEVHVDPQDSRPSGSPIKNAPGVTEPEPGSDAAQAVRLELKRILDSRYFKTAGRSRQFLQFVVEHRLAGHPDQLKERTIGTEVFQRPADYATGDDPVVRVQAGEVRRRLDQFYQNDSSGSSVKIDLPVGSYCPEFRFGSQRAEAEPIAPKVPQDTAPNPARTETRSGRKTALAAALAMLVVLAVLMVWQHSNRSTKFQEFWAPLFKTPQPALICLAKGVTYRPSASLYARYRDAHPGAFQSEVERSSDPLPLDPSQTLQWHDLSLFSDYGVATGDVYAAIRISSALGSLGRPAQLRIGSDYSFQDLRTSPGVIVGAFNNKWTMNLTSNLHFAFSEENGTFVIREQASGGRIWPAPGDSKAVWSIPGGGQTQTLDYALVARLLDSNTGQFTIIAAGLTGAGTAAAGEFISSPDILERAFHDAPANWKNSNSEFVLKTKVADHVAGPPTVVASYFW